MVIVASQRHLAVYIRHRISEVYGLRSYVGNTVVKLSGQPRDDHGFGLSVNLRESIA
jgi:hypothetical protein